MNGFVFIDKPEGLTSFVTSAKTRRIFLEKKAGHTGTLDPMATGVLTVALGRATRFIELIQNHDKSYRATFITGKTTDTLDITGKVLSESAAKVSPDDVKKALEAFKGNIKQLPPMYSAVKINGVKLYELARCGVEIEREQRQVTVYSLSLISYDEKSGEYTIDVSCSGGTYIRSLIGDVGQALGCGAVMTNLRRTKANGIGIERCFTFEQLEKMKADGTLSDVVVAVDKMLAYPSVKVTEAQAVRFSNGGELSLDRLYFEKKDGLYNVYSPAEVFLGVGEVLTSQEILKVKRVYFSK